MGVQPGQRDSLAEKNQVKPFGRQSRQGRNRCIRLLLTDSEYEKIQKAAAENNSEQLAVFARMTLLSVIASKNEK